MTTSAMPSSDGAGREMSVAAVFAAPPIEGSGHAQREGAHTPAEDATGQQPQQLRVPRLSQDDQEQGVRKGEKHSKRARCYPKSDRARTGIVSHGCSGVGGIGVSLQKPNQNLAGYWSPTC